MSTALFNELLYNLDHPAWEDETVPAMPLNEVQFLCMALGAPKSGTKERIWIRLCAVRQVRAKLSKYDGDSGAKGMVADFPKPALKAMAKEAGVWRSGNKLQLAVTLLNWRNRARQVGTAFVNQQFALMKKQPRQLTLDL